MGLNLDTSFEKQSKLFLKIVAIASVITAFSGAYYFFVNNVYKPKVKVLSVDFVNGFATLEIPFGKKIEIYGDAEYLIRGDWGVKFGTIMIGDKVTYQNIQLIRKGLVDDYLDVSEFIK